MRMPILAIAVVFAFSSGSPGGASAQKAARAKAVLASTHAVGGQPPGTQAHPGSVGQHPWSGPQTGRGAMIIHPLIGHGDGPRSFAPMPRLVLPVRAGGFSPVNAPDRLLQAPATASPSPAPSPDATPTRNPLLHRHMAFVTLLA